MIDPDGLSFRDAMNVYMDGRLLEAEDKSEKKQECERERQQFQSEDGGRSPINPLLPPSLFPPPSPRPPIYTPQRPYSPRAR